MNQQQSFEGQNSGGENSGLGDWSFDNLDEIVAVAIKAEFHTMDLAELGMFLFETYCGKIRNLRKYC